MRKLLSTALLITLYLGLTTSALADDAVQYDDKGNPFYEKANGDRVVYGVNGKAATQAEYLAHGEQLANQIAEEHERMWGGPPVGGTNVLPTPQGVGLSSGWNKEAENEVKENAGLVAQRQAEARSDAKKIAADIRGDAQRHADEVKKEQFVKPKVLVSLDK